MKLCIYSRPFYPSVGGCETTSQLLAAVSRSLGFDVVVLTETQLDGRSELIEDYKIVRTASLWQMARQARTADVVISKGGVSVRIGLLAMLFIKKLIIYHESYGPVNSENSLNLKDLLRKAVFAYACMHVGVSHACLGSKNIPHSKKQMMIYNPVAPDLVARSLTSKGDVIKEWDILFVGRLIESKGIILLARALKLLEDGGEAPKVLIAGAGEDEQLFRHSICGLTKTRVHMCGALHGSDLAEAYRRSRLLVMPSLVPEGMGLVIAEALIFGLPVVGADQAAIIEIMGPAGIVFRSGDVNELVDSIRQLLHDTAAYRQLSRWARERANVFTHEVFAQKVRNMLDTVVEMSA